MNQIQENHGPFLKASKKALLLHEHDENGRAVGKSLKKFHRGVPHQNLAKNEEIAQAKHALATASAICACLRKRCTTCTNGKRDNEQKFKSLCNPADVEQNQDRGLYLAISQQVQRTSGLVVSHFSCCACNVLQGIRPAWSLRRLPTLMIPQLLKGACSPPCVLLQEAWAFAKNQMGSDSVMRPLLAVLKRRLILALVCHWSSGSLRSRQSHRLAAPWQIC